MFKTSTCYFKYLIKNKLLAIMMSCRSEEETNKKKRLSMEKKAIDCGLPDNKEFEEAMIMTVLET
uniref:Uncharacterized protein n=1 Tax=Brassica campestris TaxID=3711 RepID=A0A3P5YLV3_BRACM|nr:unnamed protein product [Brassica rapa]